MTRKRFAPLLLWGALALVPGCILGAQGQDIEKQMDSERISLDLKDASAKDLFRVYKDLLGVEVRYDCPDDKKVSFSFEEILVRTSLNALCESAGLQWTLEPGTPPVLRITCVPPPSGGVKKVIKVNVQGGPSGAAEPEVRSEVKVRRTKGGDGSDATAISIDLKEAQISEALRLAARLMNATLKLDPALEGKTVTLKMEAVPLPAFLDAACRQAGATWRLKEGQPPTLEVSKAP